MNREIRYRAWDNLTEEFLENVEDLTLRNLTNSDSMVHLGNGSYHEAKHFVFEQYTGLKDKNGVEIYEGDIIQRVQIIITVRTVIFYEGCFMGENHKPHPTDTFTRFPIKEGSEWEIIGNIHE